ncbi:MAG: hypothetical protein AAGJ87_13350, partial [Pseudomonadota bacterium]
RSCNEPARFVRDMTFIGAGGVMAATVILGLGSLQERYVIPFMTPGLIWMVDKARRSDPSRRRIQAFSAGVVSLIAIFAAARLVQTAVPGAPFCSSCRQWIPYDAVIGALEKEGAAATTIVAATDNTAGNLRRAFPSARVLSLQLPFYAPPERPGDGRCFFVWSTDLGPPPSDALLESLYSDEFKEVIGDWRHFAREPGWRQTAWTIAQVDHVTDAGAQLCRFSDD